jgi:hypothetical protein
VAILVSNPGLGNNVCGNMHFFMGKSTRNRKITIFYMGKSTFSMFTLKGIQFSNPPIKKWPSEDANPMRSPWNPQVSSVFSRGSTSEPLNPCWTPAEPLGCRSSYPLYHIPL